MSATAGFLCICDARREASNEASFGKNSFWYFWPSEATSCLAMQGQAVDIRIHAEEMRRMANRLYEIYSKHTGQPVDVIGESQHDCRV